MVLLEDGMIQVLMIEDDLEMAQLIKDYLKKYSIQVTNYPSPLLGLNSLERNQYLLVILDLTLPGMDGLEVCKTIRDKYDIPIIITSARKETSDRVLGLGLGADDYLSKPYDPRELVARIQSILRRYQKKQHQTVFGDFKIDNEMMQIYKNNKPLTLSRAEYEILKLLIKSGNVISREYILDNIDVIDYDSSERSIDVIISRIRHKIGDNPKNPKYIQSIRSVGYKFIQ